MLYREKIKIKFYAAIIYWIEVNRFWHSDTLNYPGHKGSLLGKIKYIYAVTNRLSLINYLYFCFI